MSSGPSLLLDLESRWQGFKSSVAPAFHHSAPKLGIECDGRAITPRGFSTSLALHVIALIAILLSPKVTRPNVVLVENYTPTEITYYAGAYLPQMKDAAGVSAGVSGRKGGSEGFHPLQVIRVSRGTAAVDKNIDAPNIHPSSKSELANLVALTSAAAPAPPTEAMRQSLRRQLAVPVPEVVQPAVENPRMKMSAIRISSISPQVVQPTIDDQQLKSKLAPVRMATISQQVVQPAPNEIRRDTLSISKLVLPQSDVVPPAPDTAKLRLPRDPATQELASAAVPPPPSLEQFSHGDSKAAQLAATQISAVQPAPAVDQLSQMNGRTSLVPAFGEIVGTPAEFAGTGGATGGKPEVTSMGSGEGTGGGDQKIQAVVISANPGNDLGAPSRTDNGSIAMSPKGAGVKGLGGSGGGTGNAKGSGSGSGANGSGPGAATAGKGPGADANAKNGISNKPGPGGTGDGGTNTAMPSGITIAGGSVTLPAFGPANVPVTSSPGKVLGPRHAPSITVVGSARSGGALSHYGELNGGKIYTIYIQTRLGTAVLEFAEQPSSVQHFEADLTAPEPMESEIPADVRNSRMVVACVIGSDGVLRNLRVLESAATDMSAKILAALQGWRFRPVLRGDQAIAVDAILGFDIDTR
jgi:hypothetical protein